MSSPHVITDAMRRQARQQAASAIAAGADPIAAALDAVDVALAGGPTAGQITDEAIDAIWNGISVHSTTRTQKKALRAGIEQYLDPPSAPTATMIDAVVQEMIDEGFTDLNGRAFSWERHGESLRAVAGRLLAAAWRAIGR